MGRAARNKDEARAAAGSSQRLSPGKQRFRGGGGYGGKFKD
jgi:hypothetical protein